MCIIVCKKKDGKLPKKEYLKNCFDNNDDGSGLMYVKKINGEDKVVIEKGFMTWDAFYKRYEELCLEFNNFENKSLVCHFRIGTQGNNDAQTCHPFPISSKNRILRKTYVETDVGMVHNGIISTYSKNCVYAGEKDALLSDTQLFIKHCVLPFKSLNRQFYKNKQVMKYLDDICGGKLVFLNNEDNVYMVGEFVEHDGVFYSNGTYSYNYYDYYKTYSKYNCAADPYDWYEDDYPYGDGFNQHFGNCKVDSPYLDGYIFPLKPGQNVVLEGSYEIMGVGSNDKYYYDNYYGGLYGVVDGLLKHIGYIDKIMDSNYEVEISF